MTELPQFIVATLDDANTWHILVLVTGKHESDTYYRPYGQFRDRWDAQRVARTLNGGGP